MYSGSYVVISCYDRRDYLFLREYFEECGYETEHRDVFTMSDKEFPDFPHSMYGQYEATCMFYIKQTDKTGLDKCIRELKHHGYHCVMDWIHKEHLKMIP